MDQTLATTNATIATKWDIYAGSVLNPKLLSKALEEPEDLQPDGADFGKILDPAEQSHFSGDHPVGK